MGVLWGVCGGVFGTLYGMPGMHVTFWRISTFPTWTTCFVKLIPNVDGNNVRMDYWPVEMIYILSSILRGVREI